MAILFVYIDDEHDDEDRVKFDDGEFINVVDDFEDSQSLEMSIDEVSNQPRQQLQQDSNSCPDETLNRSRCVLCSVS